MSKPNTAQRKSRAATILPTGNQAVSPTEDDKAKPELVYIPPVVVTVVGNPRTGAVAITPVFDTPADVLIRMLQAALQQVTAFAAVENAKLTAASSASPSTT